MKTKSVDFKEAKKTSVEAIRQAQTKMLREHLLYIHKKSPAYRTILSSCGVPLEKFELEDLSHLPFTEKAQIEKNPAAFLAVSQREIADIVLSSGTTGKPLQIFYTAADLERLAYNESQAFENCGIGEDDTALLTCTMDRCFVAGLAYYLGLRARGAAVIRNGHGLLESHAELIETMKPTVIVGVPSFLKKFGHYLKEKKKDPAFYTVRKLICIGEPLSGRRWNALAIRSELESLWNAKTFSTYASSETISTFCECSAQRGGHLLPELAVVEIIDDKGNVLPDGAEGEVVVAPMAVEGMPLIRYKTGDISFLENTPCSCGLFSLRLGPILGRKNQLMKLKGTSLYPSAVFSVLDELSLVTQYYLEVKDGETELSDRLIVHASVKNESASQTMLVESFVSKLRVKPEIIIENEDVIKKKVFPAGSRKPIRFYDERKRCDIALE